MKRDPELIRNIMLEVEKVPPGKHVTALSFDDIDNQTIIQHVVLLIEAGLLSGNFTKVISGPAGFRITGLTWFGHDFVDAVREHSIWKVIKDKVLKPAGSWTFGLVTEVAKEELKNRLGI